MRQKNVVPWILVFVSTLLLALSCGGCGGSGGGGGGGGKATIEGTVLDRATGAGLDGVAVSAGSATATTSNGGRYSLKAAPAADLVVKAVRTGYVSTLDLVTVAAGETHVVQLALNPVGGSYPVADLSVDNTVTDPRNTRVILKADSLVDGDGTPVASATVDVTTALPGDANYTATFPGLFVGIMNDAETDIESFGFVTVDITSDGEPCNLAAGSTAEIVFPIDPSADPGTATIELWSLDEVTGLWDYEGDAVRDDSASPSVYRATVSHFSTFNLDRPVTATLPYEITVGDGSGPVAGAAVTVVSVAADGGRWEGRGVTGTDGVCHFAVVPAGTVQVTAAYASLVGSAYLVEDAGDKYTMTITLREVVSRTFTVVRMVGGSEVPVAGASVFVFAEGGDGHSFAEGVTGSNGTVAVQVEKGLSMYGLEAWITIDGADYSAYANGSSLSDLPSKIVLSAD